MIDLSDRTNMFYWQTNRKLSADETKKIFMERYGDINEDVINKIIAAGMKRAGYTGKDTEIQKLDSIIKQGSVNTVMPVTLISGKQAVVRVHPKGVKNGYFWVEKTATDKARKKGVPTYETIVIDDSQKIVPYDFMIMSRIAGRPMVELSTSDPTLDERLVRETGRYAGLIHKIQPEGFGFFRNTLAKESLKLVGQYKSFKEHIFAALEEDLTFLTDNGLFTSKHRKSIESIFNKNDDLMSIKKGSLIHNDIADWNEMSDGRHITGIMDWDECFSGDPLMEVAAYSLFFPEPRLTWFREGYNETNKLDYDEDKFQLFKLRYLVSKLHLRKKRAIIDQSSIIQNNIKRGMVAMEELFTYFGL